MVLYIRDARGCGLQHSARTASLLLMMPRRAAERAYLLSAIAADAVYVGLLNLLLLKYRYDNLRLDYMHNGVHPLTHDRTLLVYVPDIQNP